MCAQTYAAQEGPYQERAKEIYAELRKNVVDNVHKVRLPRCGVVFAQPADTSCFANVGVRPHGVRVGAIRRPHRRGPQEVRPRFSSLGEGILGADAGRVRAATPSPDGRRSLRSVSAPPCSRCADR